MGSYKPATAEVLKEIADKGGFDAVYDVTATKVPKQEGTGVLLAVKVFDGNAVEASQRFFLSAFSPGDVVEVVFRLREIIMEDATGAGLNVAPGTKEACSWTPGDAPMSSGYIPGCSDEIHGYGKASPGALCPFCSKPMALDTEGFF